MFKTHYPLLIVLSLNAMQEMKEEELIVVIVNQFMERLLFLDVPFILVKYLKQWKVHMEEDLFFNFFKKQQGFRVVG
jgi:hypothetical protein